MSLPDPFPPAFNQSRPRTLHITSRAQFLRDNKATSGRVTRVCFVTSAISGPTLNGGIATAFHSLAQHLALRTHGRSAKRTFAITVLYAAHPYYSTGTADEWRERFGLDNIDFVPLPESPIDFYGQKLVVRSYRIYEWLREHDGDFDIISYHDNMGNGYYTALAKHQQLNFRNTLLYVQCHSTVRWADMLNYRPPKDIHTLAYYYMEQKSIEYADVRVSPSQYYLEWMQDVGWYDLSHGLSFVLPNALYPLRADVQSVRICQSRHFVFFSRLETRKGLIVLLDALDQLQQLGLAPERVSFVGPSAAIDGILATELVRQRAAEGKWTCTVDFEHGYNTERALEFIRTHNAIAMLPTLGDNSPYALMEVAAAGLPLITSDAGGGKELFTDDASQSVVFPSGDSDALAAVMRRAMTDGIPTVPLKHSLSATRDMHVQLMQAFNTYIGRHAEPDHKSVLKPDLRVTVGVTTHNRADQLFECVRSVANQDYPHHLLHVIIVDDASTDPDVSHALDRCERMLQELHISYEIERRQKKSFVASTRNNIFAKAQARQDDFACLLVRADDTCMFVCGLIV